MFQVHLWCGLAIGLYASLIGLTGSILVFRPEIEHLLRPHLFTLSQVSPHSGSKRTLDDLLIAGEKAQPAFLPAGFEDLPETATAAPDKPIILYMSPRPSFPRFAPVSRTPEELLVYFDPRDGHILGARSRYAGLLGFAANLHYYLLAGSTGYIVNGIFALLFLIVCLTGWIVWWPGLRRTVAALRIHGLWQPARRRWNLRRLNWDLHTVGGFWSNPALIAVALTGVYFVFPTPLLSVIAMGRSGHMRQISEWFRSPPISQGPAGHSAVSVQQAWIAATAACPTGVRVSYLALPSGEGEAYEAIAYYSRTAPYAQPYRLFVDRYTGGVAKILDSRSLPSVLRGSLYVYAIHFGSFAGAASRVLWFLLGLTPAALFLSGTLMWWHRMRFGVSRSLRRHEPVSTGSARKSLT